MSKQARQKNPKENQRIVLTKRLLREALLDMLNERPLADISVSELCRVAGINRSTFYAHYGNPADLFDEIEAGFFCGLHACIDAAEEENGPLDLGCRVATICTYLRENEALAKLMFTEPNRIHDIAFETFSIPIDGQSVEKMLDDTYDNVSCQLLFTFLTYGIYQLIRQWLLDDMPKTPEQIGQLASKVAYNGWLPKHPSSM